MDADTNGTGAVTRSNDFADGGTYSAKCFTTASGDIAQVRDTLNSTWPPASREYVWQRTRMYIPSATINALSGSEYMDIIGIYASAGSGGGYLRVMASGTVYGYLYDPFGTPIAFNIYGTIPTDQWFDIEVGMDSLNSIGVERSYAFIINGAFYGWYRRSNDDVTINRVSAGILATNSADDLIVYIDNWYLYGTSATPCGTDNRPTASIYTKNYRDLSGENVEFHWYTWTLDLRLDPTHGFYSHDTRLQGGINHALMPSLATDGWAEMQIGWPNGTPPYPPADQWFSALLAFKKDIPNEENLEIQFRYTGSVVRMIYDAWVSNAPNVIASWTPPIDHVTGERIPGEDDKVRVKWGTSGTSLHVVVDYYDDSAGTWSYAVIDNTSDVTSLGGHDFSQAAHDTSSLTTDSIYYSIKYQTIGAEGTFPSASASVSPSASLPIHQLLMMALMHD